MTMKGNESGTFAGTAVVVNLRDKSIPITVCIDPAGGQAKAEVSATKDAFENPAGARWADWAPGTVAAVAMTSITSEVTAIRFTRISGGGNCAYDIAW